LTWRSRKFKYSAASRTLIRPATAFSITLLLCTCSWLNVTFSFSAEVTESLHS
jgi:hypothetical protein